MEKRNYDVVVVGGGPAGCMAAKYAAREGASTLIIEDDAKIGEPVQCAGLISRRALDESELKNWNAFMNCEIKGAVVRSQNAELVLEAPDKRAFAIRRDLFDRELAKEAQNAGAELKLGSKVKRVQRQEGGRTLTITTARARANGAQEIEARVVIGADGVKSTVAKSAGLTVAQRSVNCVQIEGEYEMEGEPFAEIFVGETVAPGFFAWTIPLGTDDNRARIGLCIDRKFSADSNPLHFLKRNLSAHPVIAKKYKGTVYTRTAGSIPIPVDAGLRGRRHKTVKISKGTGILLVGDAAAQIKPVTGGGVYYGMKCGKIAGETAARACVRDDMRVLNEYDRKWQRDIGKEMAFGLKVHRLRGVMSDKDFDALLRTLAQNELLQRIKEKGDMDYPSIVLHGLLTNPCLVKVMARNIPRYLYTK